MKNIAIDVRNFFCSECQREIEKEKIGEVEK